MLDREKVLENHGGGARQDLIGNVWAGAPRTMKWANTAFAFVPQAHSSATALAAAYRVNLMLQEGRTEVGARISSTELKCLLIFITSHL
jgi:hypothetical protein